MRRLWLVVLSVLVLCGCTVTEKEAVFPPEISVETVDVELYKELPDAYGITVFQDRVVVVNNTEDGSEYYLVSMDGKEAEFLMELEGERCMFDAVATESHFYIPTLESKYIETSDEWEYTQRIYSCTFDGCEVIKEEMDDCYICGGPLFDLETYNNDLYEMDVAVGGVYNKLSKYDENSKQWTVVLDMGTHSNWESLVSNNEHLGLSYVKETDNGEMLYLNLLTGDQIQTEIYELPKDLYNGYSSFSVDPILYNDHIAIPVRKENSSTCNYLIYTDEYEEMENTVPCRFDSIMISDELYLSINDSFSTSRYVNHSINKISDDIVESNVIDIDGIQLSRLDNFFYVINENTVLDMGNHDGKWYIIHMQ